MAEKSLPHMAAYSRKQEDGSPTYLDQTLWRQLVNAEDSDTFYFNWIALQSRIITAVHRGVVVVGPPGKGPFTPVCTWPEEKQEFQSLSGVIERALKERKGVVIKEEKREAAGLSEKALYHIAYPVQVSGDLHGAVALEISPRPQEQLQLAMRQLQWGIAWIGNWILKKAIQQNNFTKDRITTALDLAAVALQEHSFQAAATAFVTELATRLSCDRVSIGYAKGKHVKVYALSHSSQFKKQMNLIRSIGDAMEESIDQHSVIVYPDTSEGEYVIRAHSELAKHHGAGTICTIPFIDKEGRGFGALNLERSKDKPFDREIVELCESVAALVAPILEEKRKNDRLLIKKIGESTGVGVAKLVGPGHMTIKLVGAVLLMLIIFFIFAKGEYRVTAKTAIEGAVQRAVTAPFDGYIYEAYVQAGDTVAEGEIMCRLDDRDLHLELVRWTSQRQQHVRQYREAMAEGNRANMKIMGEQVNQSKAQIALINEQISRATMRAPFAAVVVSGDLSQSLGSPVERGQVLFEVAPLHGYRVKLQVDEHDISYISAGQNGKLVLNALPQTDFTINVKKVTPVTRAEEGLNYFQVEADLEQASNHIRPGMEGYSKVNVGERKLIWIWTHDLIDWVRLWMWSWWP